MIEKLKKSVLFKNIKEESIQYIIDTFEYHHKKYLKDEIVAFRGDDCDSLMIILSGKITAQMQDPNGKLIKIEDIFETLPLAPAFIFGKNHFFPIDLISPKESELIIFPKKSFLNILQYSPVFLENYLNMVCNKAQFLSQKVWFNFNNKTLEQKIASYIIEETTDDLCTLSITHAELAQVLGSERPSVSRVFKKLYDKNIIEKIDKKTLLVKDKKFLDKLIAKDF